MIDVTIRQLPVESFSYFQWFLHGLYELEDKGQLSLHFKISLIDRICLLWFDSKWVSGTIRRLIHKYIKVPRYNLIGEVSQNGFTSRFAIDCKDSPFIFTVDDLVKCDVYFKNQCPITIDDKGFEIISGVCLPWQDIKFGANLPPYEHLLRKTSDLIYKCRDKIKPGMIGPRRMGWSCRKSTLAREYKLKFTSQTNPIRKKITAYFGSALFPHSKKSLQHFDLDWESDLVSFLVGCSHPNEKRAKAVQILNMIGGDYEGRLIHDANGTFHKEQFVPLDKFSDYLSEFQYNLNISGFRLSIPNRFIESFMAGTAIVTDKLKVKWYLPFDEEVVETIPLGYEPEDKINWQQFKNDLLNLPEKNPAKVFTAFKHKWKPSKFAEYVINTSLNSHK